ncbi:hypothetical protein DK419_00200 [Methylobacterium terrae]|uniref:Uncharacterized protein n=2 Tax=Methylobacterium terrae TaxID=2202827 RepID=A0A2U8WFX1_9HYPH|nr:hypothetical protein DK419_00200 [Methylobacterium terrae]
MNEMQENNKFISAVNMYCLENRKNAASRQDIEKAKAALLDTSASADISMAEFEEKDTIAKDLICSAQRKQNEAVKIFDKTRSIFAGHAPEQWKDARNQADDIERLLSYRRRLLYIQGLIKDKSIRC